MTRKHSLLLILASALGACSNMPSKEDMQQQQMLTYECDNNFGFTAYISDSQAKLLLPEKTLTLPRMADTKGQRYISEDRKILFLRKGENAVLASGAGHGMLRCKQIAGAQ
ncbi:MliC family protein [Thiolapillus sp.]